MKIEINKNNLLKALTKAEKITGKNTPLLVLQGVVLKTLENQIELLATNLELSIKLYIPAKIERLGEIVIMPNILISYLSNIVQEEKLVLECSDTQLKIISGKSETQINTLENKDFPEISVLDKTKTCKMKSSVLVDGLKSVWYAASLSSIKPELSSVYLYSDSEELTFVATDSFRLAEKKLGVKIEEFESILIPQKNVVELIKVFEDVEQDIELVFTPNQIGFYIENTIYVTSRVVEGLFPDYRQIIPKESKTEITVLKQDLINALKISNLFSDTFNQVKFHINVQDSIFEITSKNPEKGESRTNIPVVMGGESVDINFNQKYIMDCFNSIKTESVTMHFNSVGRPVVMRGVGEGSFMYLIMPLNK